MRRAFGAYELCEELGRGGMGVVYRGVHRGTGQVVALKVLSAQLTDAASLTRFEREGLLGRQLRHPAIVRTLDMGQVGGTPFVAFEFVEGETLARAWRGWSMEARVGVVAEVAEAVGVAHGHGVVHRDLKPENVLLERGGRVRLSDFGLAAATRDVGRLTLTGELLGTPAYMAPEQLDGAVKATPQPSMDVWALGVMLYEALTGSVPFQAPSLYGLLYLIQTKSPEPPRALNPEVAPALETLCLCALDPDPELRPADGEVFALALRDALRVRGTRRTRRAVAGGVALGVGVLGAVWASEGGASAEVGAEAKVAEDVKVPEPSASSEGGAWRGELARRAFAQGQPLVAGGWLGPSKWLARASAWEDFGPGWGLWGEWLLKRGDPEAAAAFARAIELEYPGGWVGLAACQGRGLGVPKDPDRGVGSLLEAESRGADLAQLVLSWLRNGWSLGGRGREVVERLEQAGRDDDVNALLVLAELYGNEPHGVRDNARGLDCLRRAAELGSADASYKLWDLYHQEPGRPDLRELALRRLREAVSRGHETARARYAFWLMNRAWGMSDPVGQRAAVEEARRVLAAGGTPQSPLGLRAEAELWVRWSGDPGLVRRGVAQLEELCARGDAEAMVQLGMVYGSGVGVAVDLARCEAWLVRAAELGQPLAAKLLAQVYFGGQLPGGANPEEGARCLRRGAELGDPECMLNVAVLYAHGWAGTAQDLVEARRWLERAAAAGHSWARRRLAEVGDGTMRAADYPSGFLNTGGVRPQ